MTDPLILHGRHLDPRIQTGIYGTPPQVLRQQGRDAKGQLGYPCDAPTRLHELTEAAGGLYPGLHPPLERRLLQRAIEDAKSDEDDSTADHEERGGQDR